MNHHVSGRRLSPPVAIAFALAVGCGGDEGSTPALVAGASVVFVGPTVGNGGVLSTQGYDLFMQDVHHDASGWIVMPGARWDSVAVWHFGPVGCDCSATTGSAGGRSEFPILAGPDVSTLAAVSFPESTSVGYPLGIHRNPARTLLTGVYEPDSALGNGVLLSLLLPVDLAGATVGAGIDLHTTAHPHVTGPALRGVTVDDFGGYLDGLGYGSEVDHWELSLDPQGERFPGGLDLLSTDSLTYEAYFRRSTVTGVESLCRVVVDYVGDHTPRSTCAPLLAFPAPFRDRDIKNVITSHGVVGLATDLRGAVFAVDIDGAGEPHTYPLGKGEYRENRRRIRSAYGPLVRIAGGAADRYVDLRADGGVDELVLPLASPCLHASQCRGADLLWLEPTGAAGSDDFMGFWLIDRSKATEVYERQEIIAVPIRAERRAADTSGFLADDGTTEPSPIPEFPNAFPGGALERACLAAASCAGGAIDVETCIGEWATVPPRSPAYQQFIAATGSDCSALDAAWGKPAARKVACQYVTCVGDVLVTACNGSLLDMIDCHQIGTTCRAIDATHAECSDGTARPECNTCTPSGGAVHCRPDPRGGIIQYVEACPAAGQTCQAIGGEAACFFPEPCQASDGCADDFIDSCDLLHDPTLTRYRASCSDLGLSCTTTDHGDGCDNPGYDVGCVAHSFEPQCVGSYAVSCRGDNVHYVDCQDLGFTQCVSNAGANQLRCE